jgi:hypothetical protein
MERALAYRWLYFKVELSHRLSPLIDQSGPGSVLMIRSDAASALPPKAHV